MLVTDDSLGRVTLYAEDDGNLPTGWEPEEGDDRLAIANDEVAFDATEFDATQQVERQLQPALVRAASLPSQTQPASPESDDFQSAWKPTSGQVRSDEETDAGFTPIGELTADIAPQLKDEEGQPLALPKDAAKEYFARHKEVRQIDEPRRWASTEFNWEASELHHQPLYYEEINLERYGYSFGDVQPFVSAVHFAASTVLLPYQMTVDPPHECIYTLGHYRPGNCVPFQYHQLPWELEAALVEAGVITGLFFIFP